MAGIEAYPLAWPEGWKRTRIRSGARFKQSFTGARDFLFAELHRMEATNCILSTNLQLRRDGLPLANQRNPEDAGAAVYFSYKKRGMVFACDRYARIEHNIYAIALTIEALRGIERWGASDMMERAFTGFTALPASTQTRSWRFVLGLPDFGDVTRQMVEEHFRARIRFCHPDTGGSHEAMIELNSAREQGQREAR